MSGRAGIVVAAGAGAVIGAGVGVCQAETHAVVVGVGAHDKAMRRPAGRYLAADAQGVGVVGAGLFEAVGG